MTDAVQNLKMLKAAAVDPRVKMTAQMAIDEIERLRSAMREIAAPTKGDPSRQRFQRIAKEALGMDSEDAALIDALQQVHDKEALENDE